MMAELVDVVGLVTVTRVVVVTEAVVVGRATDELSLVVLLMGALVLSPMVVTVLV